MRPVAGTAVFIVASPLLPRVAPCPVGLGGVLDPKGRGTALLIGATEAGAGDQGFATGGGGALRETGLIAGSGVGKCKMMYFFTISPDSHGTKKCFSLH